MSFFSSMLGNSGVVDPQKLRDDYGRLLAHGEVIEVGFAVVRATFVFTTKRLILVDVQRLTGKKIEYLSIPYSKLTTFSIETAENFDLDAELKLWVGSDPNSIEKRFNKGIDIYDLQSVLARHVLS